MLVGLADQVWPSAQRQRSFVVVFAYARDKQSPPRSAAKACMSSIEYRLLLAQAGHQVF